MCQMCDNFNLKDWLHRCEETCRKPSLEAIYNLSRYSVWGSKMNLLPLSITNWRYRPTYLRHIRLSPEILRLPEGCHQKLPPQRSLWSRGSNRRGTSSKKDCIDTALAYCWAYTKWTKGTVSKSQGKPRHSFHRFQPALDSGTKIGLPLKHVI